MKQLFRAGLLMMTCFALSAGAQDWYHDRDDRYRHEEWRNRLFWHVRMDLDHVQSVTWPGGHDRYRIERTKHELNELQEKLENRRYDEHELSEVIEALHRVVADNRMSPRDRDVLNDDLERLRDYREHHEHWSH